MIDLFPGKVSNQYADQIRNVTRISVANVSNINTGVSPHRGISQHSTQSSNKIKKGDVVLQVAGRALPNPHQQHIEIAEVDIEKALKDIRSSNDDDLEGPCLGTMVHPGPRIKIKD
ncbi:hypothetical protein HOG98_08525 [bacterium]|nr:hypothetical protein [bacterium]